MQKRPGKSENRLRRAWAAAVTSLMTGHAYATSARIASRMGPFSGFAANEEPMLRVLRQHRAAAARIDEELVPADLLSAAQLAWDEAVAGGEEFGVRNSQASVLAPTGTIAFMMDCDTTGVEPDIALIKYKKLVGGGMLRIVNNTVPRALKRIGYEPARMTCDFFESLRSRLPLKASLEPVHAWIEEMRMVKSPEELDRIRRSVQMNSRAFEQTVARAKVGMTERDLAAELEYRMRKLVAEKPSFETIVSVLSWMYCQENQGFPGPSSGAASG